MLNKEFQDRKRFSRSSIEIFQLKYDLVFPKELRFFYEEVGGVELEEDKHYDYYVTLDEITALFPFIGFFPMNEQLEKQVDNYWNDPEFMKASGDNKFLPIGWGHGQYRVVIGLQGAAMDKIYLYNGEECFFEKICETLREFINNHLALENELEY